MTLLPQPRQLTVSEGRCALPPDGVAWHPSASEDATPVVLDTVAEAFALTGVPMRRHGLPFVAVRPYAGKPGAYRLSITPDGVALAGADPAGLQHAAVTLRQLARQCRDTATLPCVEIEDWPDFERRGLMLDISRDKVPTMATLFGLVDLFVELKLNEFQLYTEHTFAYADHREVWRYAAPMTADEIEALDRYCRARQIDLVPNQNTFGHLDRWLNLPAYRHLAEAPDGFVLPWGPRSGAFSLCPIDPQAEAFVAERLAEVLPHFSSPFLNVGCDETWDVGQGRSREAVAQRGGRVYFDFLLKIHRLVAQHGRRMQFWGDIIVRHPELIPEIPRDVIALVWGYEANHPFAEHCAAFAASGLDFYVCPGTSSWCSVAGRTSNALANLRSAAIHGARTGAKGFLNTDWGDAGHWQTLPVSYLGYAAGAAEAWGGDANRTLDLEAALDQHVFHAVDVGFGGLVRELGDLSARPGIPQVGNATIFFRALQTAPNHAMAQLGRDATPYAAAAARATELADALAGARLDRPDAGLVRDELVHAATLVRWGLELCAARAATSDGSLPADWSPAAHGLPALAQLTAEHRRLWLARNRAGGLAESVARLATLVP